MTSRVLFIDKTAVLASSHERYERFARLPGWETAVLSPRMWHEHMRDVRAEVTSPQGYRVFLGATCWTGSYSHGFYVSGLKRCLSKFQPDIIQLLEEPWSFFAGQTVWLARKMCPRAKVLFYTWENIFREKTYCSKLDRIHAKIEESVFAACPAGVCATRLASEVLRKRGFTGAHPVIPYGIHETFFLSEEELSRCLMKRPNSPPRIGYIGRLLKMKGIDTLVEALPRIEGNLVVVGSGEAETSLRELAAKLRVADRIEWIPAVGPEKVVAHLRSLDVLVLPSRTTPTWAEQLGRVMLEAMASGVPVIGSTSGSIPEVIAEEGWIFPEGSAEALAATLEKVSADEAGRRQRVTAAWEKAKARYTWERFVRSHAELYTEMLHTGPRP